MDGTNLRVTATLNFYKEGGSDRVSQGGLQGNPELNFDPRPVAIEDVRGREAEFELDTQGFEFVSGKSTKHADFKDPERMEAEYYPEVERYMVEM